ncbi:MAG TPA: VOC family protein [Nocardioidaceae bacterium]|nr:VOC family protein [Nocardioidaceae bacterium]
MSRKMFVNLPVSDLPRSVTFFSTLGFRFDPEFTDERASAMVVSDGAFVMLLVEPFFTQFTGQPVPRTREVVLALSADSPDEVDDLVARAFAAGGSKAQDKMVDGPMYGWSFLDPDGHHWELIHMAPSVVEPRRNYSGRSE